MEKRVYRFTFMISIIILSFLKISSYANAEGTEEIKSFIHNYFNWHYQCLSTLEEKDNKEFYYMEDARGQKAYLLDREVNSYIIGCRKIQDNDLKLRRYNFELEYKSIKVEEDISQIALVENSEFEFNFLRDIPTRKYNITHKFHLRRCEDGWKIVEHESNEDEFIIIKSGIREFRSYEGVKDFYLNIMRENKEKDKEAEKVRYKTDNETLDSEKEAQESSTGEGSNLNVYHRQKTVDYAHRWTENGKNLRNSPPWGNYDSPNGNGDCTNFVSQCIYSGGIPMDYKGKEYEQWKWYSDTYIAAPIAKGRVGAWTGVEALYTYCKLNKGFGMKADVDVLKKDIHIGDVVQFGKKEGNYTHSVIITGYVYDDNDVLKDFLICSHTIDRNNYPLSAYSYPYRRYIHIKGWSN